MITIAAVGTSAIAERVVAASRRVDGVEFTTAFSRDGERARAFADANGMPQHASDFDALLSDDGLDAVYIASPNSIHHRQALAAIRAGKHVLVEKPATPTAAEFAELVEAADAQGVVVLEAMRTAYDPGLATITDLLESIGPVRVASVNYCKRSSRYDQLLAGERVNIFDPAMAGGAVYDLGVYCLSAVVALFGAPESVVGHSVTLSNGVDGAGSAVLSYPGMVATVTYSKISAAGIPSEIQGEEGTLIIDEISGPGSVRIEPRSGEARTIDLPTKGDNLHCSVERFAALIAGADSQTSDHTRTLDTLSIIEQLRR